MAGLAFFGLLCAAAAVQAQPAVGELQFWRDQFPGSSAAPAAPVAGPEPTRLGSGRWEVGGVETLLVRSGDPEVSAVFRLEPIDPAPGGGEPTRLRLRVIVLTSGRALGHQYTRDATVLQPQGTEPQRVFRVGERGLVTPLAGGPGRVAQMVIQDDGDAELRASREGTQLVLEVVPPGLGGAPSGTRPYYLGAPLRSVEHGLLISGYTDNVLGTLWLFDNAIGRANLLFSDTESITLLRLGATAQAWRSHAWSLWAEGGAAYLRVERSGLATETVQAAGGLTLHWRHGAWGAALHAGVMGLGDTTVYDLQGSWQALDWLGLVLTWQQLEGRSGYGLGAAVDF